MVLWIGFIIFICLLLALDLGVFNKTPHKIRTREAFAWTTLWVSLSLLFSFFIYFGYENHWFGLGQTVGHPLSGEEATLKYLTGYLIEQSLSIDNIFVIAVIFGYFKIPQILQHRVLFWGILGAIVFRGLMIGAGAYLVTHFSWIMYFFGAFLLYSAYKMLKAGDEQVEPENNPVIKLVKRFYPVMPSMKDERFFIKRMGITFVTPLFVALMVIETTDVMFAFDSIPAIFGITTDPFLVFTSNIFAILGLRSLYFVLASMLDKFQYLKYSLVVILAFVGLKMLTVDIVGHLPEWLSLGVIVLCLASGIIFSLIMDKKKQNIVDADEKAAIQKEVIINND